MTTFNNDTCSVCIDDFDNTSIKTSLKCGHTFHVDCIINCLRKSNECPNCRDTDGNPKLSISNNNNNHFDFFSDEDSDVDQNTIYSNFQEYRDFLNNMKELEKENKELKNRIKAYKIETTNIEKKSQNIIKNYEKGLNDVANEYIKSYRETVEYTEYIKEIQHIQKQYISIRKKIERNVSRKLDLEIDQTTRDFIKDYIEEQTGNLYYFKVPRRIYI
jgi:TRAF-interacting protein